MDLSIVVVSWNTRELLATCLKRVYETVSEPAFEVIVVDNGSEDDSAAMVKAEFPGVRLLENEENLGFARANNQALALSRGRYALLLNSDTEVLDRALEDMVAFMDAHPTAGAVGARLLNADGTFQFSHADFPTLWHEFLMLSVLGRLVLGQHYPSHGPEVTRGPQVVDYVGGACLMVRREALEQVGGLDEGFFMYAEETDWCYRMKDAGWEVWYLPSASITHLGGGSSRQRPSRMEAELYRSRVRFFEKHRGPRSAARLRALITWMTLPKMVLHGALRFLTAGRRGRVVTGWGELRQSLSSIETMAE
jgi:GT2 family glycosyltransferase